MFLIGGSENQSILYLTETVIAKKGNNVCLVETGIVRRKVPILVDERPKLFPVGTDRMRFFAIRFLTLTGLDTI